MFVAYHRHKGKKYRGKKMFVRMYRMTVQRQKNVCTYVSYDSTEAKKCLYVYVRQYRGKKMFVRGY